MKKTVILKLLCVVLSFVLTAACFTACGGDEDIGTQDGPEVTLNGEITENVKVKFDMECKGESMGSFIMELYPEYAPLTVANFVGLVEEGFYDGITFHRIAVSAYGPFVAQGGDPDGDGRSQPGAVTVKGEFSANGVDNTLSHTRGVVSMARTNDYNSASTQFFICYNDNYTASLDGLYAAFGKVTEGMEVVDSFLDIERDSNDKPLEDIIIKAAYIVD